MGLCAPHDVALRHRCGAQEKPGRILTYVHIIPYNAAFVSDLRPRTRAKTIIAECGPHCHSAPSENASAGYSRASRFLTLRISPSRTVLLGLEASSTTRLSSSWRKLALCSCS